MRRIVLLLLCFCFVFALSGEAGAAQRTHVIGKGHTLGKIAKRYHVSIDDLCKANGIDRKARLKVGEKLVIPDADDDKATGDTKEASASEDAADDSDDEDEEPKKPAKAETSKEDRGDAAEDSDPKSRSFGRDGMRILAVPGHEDAYYYEPVGPGRKGMKPVVMYLHGRGGSPLRDCRRWAPVARRFGWLVCPSGPSAHGDGRDWSNNWYSGQQITLATLKALRKEHGRRVQLVGNTLIGFSEGAYVALNVGVREPRTFNRWLILAGNTSYWGGSGLEELKKSAAALKRVYLITGEADSVIEGTHQLEEWLERHKVATRVSTPKDMGHEVLLEKKSGMYRAALHWLDRGAGGSKGARRSKKAAASKAARKR